MATNYADLALSLDELRIRRDCFGLTEIAGQRLTDIDSQVRALELNPTRWHSGILTGDLDVRIQNFKCKNHDLRCKSFGGPFGGIYGGVYGGVYSGLAGVLCGGLSGDLYGALMGCSYGGVAGGLYGGVAGALGSLISGFGSFAAMTHVANDPSDPILGFAGALTSYVFGVGASFLISAAPRFFENLKNRREENEMLSALNMEVQQIVKMIKPEISFKDVMENLQSDLPLMRLFLKGMVMDFLKKNSDKIDDFERIQQSLDFLITEIEEQIETNKKLREI